MMINRTRAAWMTWTMGAGLASTAAALLCTAATASGQAPQPRVRSQATAPTQASSQPSAAGQMTGTQMTPAQRADFDAAGKLFNQGDDSAALVKLKALHEQLPQNQMVAKFAAEAAVNAGESPYAIQLMKPLEAAGSQDWQAAAVLAHAYAQTGDTVDRDRELLHLRELHSTLGEPFRSRRDFLMESVPVGNSIVRFFPALTPWGPYKIQELARVYDAAGQQTLHITLESADGDQAYFAKQHPTEAAQGLRQYTLDGYGPERTENGQKVVTTSTYGFFTGDPGYAAFRAQVLDIVAGKRKPMSSQTTPVE